MAQNFASPGVRKYWETHCQLYSIEFAAFVKSDLLDASKPLPTGD